MSVCGSSSWISVSLAIALVIPKQDRVCARRRVCALHVSERARARISSSLCALPSAGDEERVEHEAGPELRDRPSRFGVVLQK